MTKVSKNIDFLTDDYGNLVGSRNPRSATSKDAEFADTHLARLATDTSGNVTGLAGPGGAHILPSGVKVYNSPALEPWRRKRARASLLGASRPAVVSFVGDSVVYGIQGNGASTETTFPNADGTYLGDTNWANFAAQIINAQLGKVTPTFWNAQDTRLTFASAASVSSAGLNGTAKSITSTGPGTITTPATTCKKFEIGYFETTSASGDTATGNFTHNTNAVGAVAVATASAFRTPKLATTAEFAFGANTLVITGTTAAPTYVTHIMGYTDGGVAIGRYGRGGWAVGDALGITANNVVSVAGQGRLLATYASTVLHDMLLLEFAHNDANMYTPAQYSAYLDSIIATVPTSIPIGLVSPPFPPTAQESGTYGVRTEYWEVMKSKAVAGSNVFHARVSDAFGPYETAVAEGLNVGSSVHPLSLGYGLAGQWLANLLMS